VLLPLIPNTAENPLCLYCFGCLIFRTLNIPGLGLVSEDPENIIFLVGGGANAKPNPGEGDGLGDGLGDSDGDLDGLGDGLGDSDLISELDLDGLGDGEEIGDLFGLGEGDGLNDLIAAENEGMVIAGDLPGLGEDEIPGDIADVRCEGLKFNEGDAIKLNPEPAAGAVGALSGTFTDPPVTTPSGYNPFSWLSAILPLILGRFFELRRTSCTAKKSLISFILWASGPKPSDLMVNVLAPFLKPCSLSGMALILLIFIGFWPSGKP